MEQFRVRVNKDEAHALQVVKVLSRMGYTTSIHVEGDLHKASWLFAEEDGRVTYAEDIEFNPSEYDGGFYPIYTVKTVMTLHKPIDVDLHGTYTIEQVEATLAEMKKKSGVAVNA